MKDASKPESLELHYMAMGVEIAEARVRGHAGRLFAEGDDASAGEWREVANMLERMAAKMHKRNTAKT